MSTAKEFKFEIEEPLFDQFRADYNEMLRRTFGMMTLRNIEDAVITTKQVIHFERQNIPDGGISREASIPRLKHDISAAMQLRDKMSGQIKGEYEIVFDSDGNPFYRPINNGQTSMWDEEGLVDISEDSYAEQDAKSLSAPPVAQIESRSEEPMKKPVPFGRPYFQSPWYS